MKQLILSAAIALFSVSAMAQSGGATMKTLPIGSSIPAKDVKLHAVDGNYYTLASLKSSKGLLVMFSCNTCPFVIKSQQRTGQIMKMAHEMNVPMIILNSNEAQRTKEDSYDEMKQYASAQSYFKPYAVDEKSQVANAFGATRTPEVFLFNGNGKLVYSGAMEDNPTDPANSKQMFLADAMTNMAAGKTVSPATTKSIGCSIKRDK